MLKQLRQAWRLWRTDSRIDTVAALLILGVVAVPFVRAYWEVKQAGSR